RPSYIEQLGMYCAMVGVPEGRIVIYQRSAPSDGCAPLSVCCVRFNDLEVIKAEIHRRRELLERALASGDPSALPVCPWGHWGCDYSAVCDCKTSRVPASHVVLKQMVSLEADEAAARELLAKLAQRGGRPKALRLNDIVFPRKAYYERLRPEAPADEEVQELETRGQLSSMQKWGSTSAVLDALRYGPSGGCRRAPVALDSLKDMVQFHQERPTIVRTSPFRSIVERERLAQTCSHYVLRLGFECALAGESRGRLVMYYSNVPRDDAKLMVYDISFGDIGALRAEAASRVHLLEIGAGPAELPPCPSWMAKLCSYSPGCGCGEAQPRMW
ncbi:MAG: hypothetical protein HYX95_00155, partial [Chloroflexi bacterium]|nr:hypothetical protein [Chloroflexota bacterium]